MHRRQITLEDGRYLVFYTFDEETPAAVEAASANSEADGGARDASTQGAETAEAGAAPEATEERHV